LIKRPSNSLTGNSGGHLVSCERRSKALQSRVDPTRILEAWLDENVEVIRGAHVSVQDNRPTTHHEEVSLGITEFDQQVSEVLR